MVILSVTPKNPLLWTFRMENFHLGIAKISIIPENPVFPNPAPPKTSALIFGLPMFLFSAPLAYAEMTVKLSNLSSMMSLCGIFIGFSWVSFLIELLMKLPRKSRSIILKRKRCSFSSQLSMLCLLFGLISTSKYFHLDKLEQKFEAKFSAAISIHVLGRNILITNPAFPPTRSFLEHITVVEMNNKGHSKCFENGLWIRRISSMLYKNAEGVVKASYRAYVDERDVFIHCTQPDIERPFLSMLCRNGHGSGLTPGVVL